MDPSASVASQSNEAWSGTKPSDRASCLIFTTSKSRNGVSKSVKIVDGAWMRTLRPDLGRKRSQQSNMPHHAKAMLTGALRSWGSSQTMINHSSASAAADSSAALVPSQSIRILLLSHSVDVASIDEVLYSSDD